MAESSRRPKRSTSVAGTTAGIAVGVVLVVGVGLSRIGGVGGLGGEPAPTCADPVAWDDAAALVGDRAAVAGPVAAVAYEPEVGGAPTFVNLGNPYPQTPRFDVVVYEDVRVRFDARLEDALDGRRICVQGEVRDRDGVPQIVLDAPAFLTDLDGTVPDDDREP
jgi:hypothetical protein